MAQNRTAPARVDDRDPPCREELGRAFLRPEYVSRFVVASPGDISVRCDLAGQQPPQRKAA